MKSSYPHLNDTPHPRPVLSSYGDTPLGELVWLSWVIGIPLLGILAMWLQGGQ